MPEKLDYAPNTQYMIERSRVRNEGIVVVPVAGVPPQNCSLVRLHAPIEIEEVMWSATREGAPPQIPSPKSLVENPNRVFLGGEQTAVLPALTLAGHMFVVAGIYRYAIVGPERLDSKFFIGKQPWDWAGPDENHIPGEAFMNGIVSKESQKDQALLPSSLAAAINAAQAASSPTTFLTPIIDPNAISFQNPIANPGSTPYPPTIPPLNSPIQGP